MACPRHLLEAPSSQDLPPYSSIVIFPVAESQLVLSVIRPSCFFLFISLFLHLFCVHIPTVVLQQEWALGCRRLALMYDVPIDDWVPV
jgi:hypothetical protein